MKLSCGVVTVRKGMHVQIRGRDLLFLLQEESSSIGYIFINARLKHQ